MMQCWGGESADRDGTGKKINEDVEMRKIGDQANDRVDGQA